MSLNTKVKDMMTRFFGIKFKLINIRHISRHKMRLRKTGTIS